MSTRHVRWFAALIGSMLLSTRVAAQPPPADTKAVLDQQLERSHKAKPTEAAVARVRKGSREVTFGKASAAGVMRTSTTRDTTAVVAPPARSAATKRKG
jgi:hypothetical protein